MLSPFEEWSNCTEKDARNNLMKGGVRSYYPMDSDDLRKTSEMPGAGALYPKMFEVHGYWWWKAQEITYALRPKRSTLDVLMKLQIQRDWNMSNITVFQVRRTDKTDGCRKTYELFNVVGEHINFSCKAEARAPTLRDFIREAQFFGSTKKILIVTDDREIQHEIKSLIGHNLDFVTPDPAPKRIVDKAFKGGVYKHRAMKDATDILIMSVGDPLIFTYSSGFGALALQLKQTRELFCSNWASLDWGKREWPPIGTIGQGGVRGVKLNTIHASNLCHIECLGCIRDQQPYCKVILKKNQRENKIQAPIRSFCNCARNKSLAHEVVWF
ncbi:unnamed protein product [Bathycoccus prasinos]